MADSTPGETIPSLILLERIRSEQCSTSYHTALTAHKSRAALHQNWILDTGATNHMTGNPDLLYDIQSVKPILVMPAAGNIVITRVGKACIKGDRGNIITLRKVYLTDSEDTPNLLSYSVACKANPTMNSFLDGQTCTINIDDDPYFTATKHRSLYLIPTRNSLIRGPTGIAMAAVLRKTPENPGLWHSRFGHVGLGRLVTDDTVSGIKTTAKEFKKMINIPCEICILSKMDKTPYHTSTTRASTPLAIIHIDMSGKMKVPSLNGSLYFLGILDDGSKYSIMTIHMTKSTVPKDTIAELERYENLVEKESARSSATMPQNTTALNSPHDKPPYEMFYGTKPKVNHLRIIGCTAYVHIPVKSRYFKFAPSAKITRLIGYSDNRKAHRVVDENHKIFDARDITFNEHENLAGLKGFPGPDDIVQGEYVPSTPTEPELEQRQDPPPQPFRHYPNKPTQVWGDISMEHSFDTSLTPNTVQQEIHINPQNSAPNQQPHIDHVHENNHPSDQPGVESEVEQEHGHIPTYTTIITPHPHSPPIDPILDITPPDPQLRRSDRATKKLDFLSCLAASDVPIPKNEKEALSSEYSEEWIASMTEELNALLDMKTWSLSELPPGSKAIGTKWVFDLKRMVSGEIDRFKARLVAKGYAQRPGMDYDEVFAPVAKLATIRFILSMAADPAAHLAQLDVSTAFLNGIVEEEIYCTQPPGFEKDHRVCRMWKCPYASKQASRQWYLKVKEDVMGIGFKEVDVDDFLLLSFNKEILLKYKTAIMSLYKTRDLGEPSGDITRNRAAGTLHICQSRFIKQVLKSHSMLIEPCSTRFPIPLQPDALLPYHEKGTPESGLPLAQIVGSLNYLAVNTRPDIAQVVNRLARHSAHPLHDHMKAATACPITRKSTTGWVFLNQGGAIAWASKIQSSATALSSTEAEYMAASSAAQEAMWLRKLQFCATGIQPPALTINGDNQAALSAWNQEKLSTRLRHMETRFHFLKEESKKQGIRLNWIPTAANMADKFT
eukprot:gene29062-biopygen32929